MKKYSAPNQAHGRGTAEGEEPVARSIQITSQVALWSSKWRINQSGRPHYFFILLICMNYTISAFRLILEVVMVRRKSWLLVISRGSHKSRSLEVWKSGSL